MGFTGSALNGCNRASSSLWATVGTWLFASSLLAQVGSAVITGVVTDPTNTPVPNANVRVVNEALGVATELRTNEAGVYRASSLMPGVYTVQSQAQGFAPSTRTHVELSTAQSLA